MAYRLHVGTFTSEADDVDDVSRGTFLGILKKVPHLLKLGRCLQPNAPQVRLEKTVLSILLKLSCTCSYGNLDPL